MLLGSKGHRELNVTTALLYFLLTVLQIKKQKGGHTNAKFN